MAEMLCGRTALLMLCETRLAGLFFIYQRLDCIIDAQSPLLLCLPFRSHPRLWQPPFPLPRTADKSKLRFGSMSIRRRSTLNVLNSSVPHREQSPNSELHAKIECLFGLQFRSGLPVKPFRNAPRSSNDTVNSGVTESELAAACCYSALEDAPCRRDFDAPVAQTNGT